MSRWLEDFSAIEHSLNRKSMLQSSQLKAMRCPAFNNSLAMTSHLMPMAYGLMIVEGEYAQCCFDCLNVSDRLRHADADCFRYAIKSRPGKREDYLISGAGFIQVPE